MTERRKPAGKISTSALQNLSLKLQVLIQLQEVRNKSAYIDPQLKTVDSAIDILADNIVEDLEKQIINPPSREIHGI